MMKSAKSFASYEDDITTTNNNNNNDDEDNTIEYIKQSLEQEQRRMLIEDFMFAATQWNSETPGSLALLSTMSQEQQQKSAMDSFMALQAAKEDIPTSTTGSDGITSTTACVNELDRAMHVSQYIQDELDENNHCSSRLLRLQYNATTVNDDDDDDVYDDAKERMSNESHSMHSSGSTSSGDDDTKGGFRDPPCRHVSRLVSFY